MMNKLFGILATIILCCLTFNVVVGAPFTGNRHRAPVPVPARREQRQCPINIMTKQTIPFSENTALPIFELSPIRLNNVTITNTGTTVQINLSEDDDEYLLQSNSASYRFAQAHFHWGKNDRSGSETGFNNKRYALEMHIVFFNSEFSSFTEAVEKGNKYTDLVVLAILFKTVEKDQDLFSFTAKMRQLEQPFSKIHHNFEDIDILPTNLSEYYEFDGSLTTPPYKEITTWIVFPEFLEVSAKQVNQFRTIHNKINKPILENARAKQESGTRPVYHVSLVR